MHMFGINLWPLDLFCRKILICTAAPIKNRIMKIVCAGMSILLFGAPPSAHTLGAYGGPCDALIELAIDRYHIVSTHVDSQAVLALLTIGEGIPLCGTIVLLSCNLKLIAWYCSLC